MAVKRQSEDALRSGFGDTIKEDRILLSAREFLEKSRKAGDSEWVFAGAIRVEFDETKGVFEPVDSEFEEVRAEMAVRGLKSTERGYWHLLVYGDESIKAHYNVPIMEQALRTIDQLTALLPDGADRSAFKAKVASEFEAAAAAGRTKAKPRLKWNKDNRPDENPAAFAWRAYAVEAAAGTLHLGVIRQDDEPLAVKLVSWLRSPANRKQVPEGFDIPTKPEWITRQLEGQAEPPRPTRIVSEKERLYQAARYRAAKVA